MGFGSYDESEQDNQEVNIDEEEDDDGESINRVEGDVSLDDDADVDTMMEHLNSDEEDE